MFRRRRCAEDFSAEIEAHLQLESDRLEEEGLAAGEAKAVAHRGFGNVTRAAERFYEADRSLWWDHRRKDLCYGWRVLRRTPSFTAVALLTMAFGIGAATAIFSVVDATLLHPLAYPHSEQLVSVEDDLPGVGAQDVGMSQPEWQDLQRSGIFQHVSPTWFDENNLTGLSRPERVRLLIVAPNYFALLGVKPQMGRGFNPTDYSPGILTEIVISDGLWKRAFGGDPHILDKSVRLDTDLYRIVGVMPPGFDAPGRIAEERNIEAWAGTSFFGLPMENHPPRSRRNLPTAIARLRPGLSLAAAQSRIDALVAAEQKQFPDAYPQASRWTVRLQPLKDRLVGSVRQSLLLLMGAVGLVLLIGCANLANLQLARASARGREMAIRQALGAGRGRLISQLLTESLLLSLAGGLLGLAVLVSTKTVLLRLVPQDLPRLAEVSVSPSVLAFALAAGVGAGVLFGLAPAMQAGRIDLIPALKESARGSTGSGREARARRFLLVAEFALSLILLVAATLLLRSFWDLLNVRLGFDPENVMAIRTRLPEPNDPKTDRYATAAQEEPFARELLRRSAALPGVQEAALGDTASIPLDESLRDLKRIADGQFLFTVEGRDSRGGQPAVAERSNVTSGYFHLLGMRLLRGRLFNDRETDTAPQVAIVNEAFARVYWPNQDALGKRFRKIKEGSPWITVVGVIADARTDSLAQANVPKTYLDLYQTGEKRLTVFLRGYLDRGAIPDQVRQQIQSLDSSLPISGVQTLAETVSASLSQRRFSMEMVALFALAALLLASVGIYGVMSYMVGSRVHEIGIRQALGATRARIVGGVLRQGLGLALTGAAIGLAGAWIVSHGMAALLYGVRPNDPLTFAGVAAVLLLVACLASYVPARRAVGVDPVVALRHE